MSASLGHYRRPPVIISTICEQRKIEYLVQTVQTMFTCLHSSYCYLIVPASVHGDRNVTWLFSMTAMPTPVI